MLPVERQPFSSGDTLEALQEIPSKQIPRRQSCVTLLKASPRATLQGDVNMAQLLPRVAVRQTETVSIVSSEALRWRRKQRGR